MRRGIELQPLRCPDRGQANLHRQRHQRKIEVLVVEIRRHQNSRGRRRGDRPVPLAGRSRGMCAVRHPEREYSGIDATATKWLDGGGTLAHNPDILLNRTPAMYVAESK